MATNLPRQSMRVISSRARSSLTSTSIRSSQRSFSSSVLCADKEKDNVNEYTEKPRWSYTPPGTKAPFSLHQLDSTRPHYHVNESPEVLNKFYISLLGKGGDKVLSDEIKWLAVTHKSFDQGRRGFNDRLALLGKRIVQLQASLNLIQNPRQFKSQVPPLEPSEEEKVVKHPALEGLENLSANSRGWLTHKLNLSKLGYKYDLLTVVRWTPKDPTDLQISGVDVVLAHTLYAIVGAIALERGGVEANKFARERILAPQGLSSI